MRICLPPDPTPSPPRFAVPEGSCDTHCHIFGPADRFPYDPDRSYTPPDASIESYLALRKALGLSRSVIVHPNPHGFDNAVTLDAIRQIGPSARGVAVVPHSVDDRDLERLNAGGMRGVRISTMLRGQAAIGDLTGLAARIAPLGWHAVLHLNAADELIELAPSIRGLPVPVVIDHLGRVRGSAGSESVAFQTLVELLTQTDHCWTKISSWYRLSDQSAPYPDMERLARTVMAARIDRVLWGSNWPHPILYEPPMPNDGDLFNEFLAWAETDARRKAVLVDNPASLYKF